MAPQQLPGARGICLATLGLLASVGASNQAVWLTAIQPFTGADWDAGISMRIGGQIMLEEINRNPNLLPGYELKVVWQDGLCAKPVGTEIFLQNLFDQKYKVFAPGKTLQELDVDGDGTVTTADTEPMSEVWNSTQVSPDPIGLLGSGCAGTALNIVKVAYMARFPIVSNSATRPGLSDRSSYPNFFRTIMPDTTFNAAWIAMAKQLNHSSVSVVIGETENWGSMGTKLAEEALSQGVRLVGNDLTSDMANFHGVRIALDSQAMAATAAADIVRYRQRVVILLMFHKRNRLVLCELYKLHYRNAVYMPMGWLPFGWWSIPDTQCAPAQLTDMAVGFISANMMFWRGDMNTRLSCSQTMTAQQFQDEWFRGQGGAHGDLSMRPEGYAPALEAATTADAACMYATMLHEVLINRGIPLSELTARTRLGYDNAFDALSNIDFEGVQGRVRFAANSADPAGSVILQQLQRSGSSLRLLDVASYNQPTFYYLGKGDLVFQFPGEQFPAGPVGAGSISGNLERFKVCTGNKVLDTLSNQCLDCPANTQLVQRAGACLCVAGYYEAAGGCAPCPGGSISTAPGALQCTSCGLGKSAPPGSTSCSFCPRGRFADSSGLETCRACPQLQTTPEIASESNASCVCETGTCRSGDGRTCARCPQNSVTRGLDSPNVSSCLCAENTYMDLTSGATCRPCPINSTTTGSGKTSVQSCLCMQGTYMSSGATSCQPCPEGMMCPKGSNAANAAYLSMARKTEEQEFPKLRAGFWSSASEPMSIFACRSAEKCPGDRYPGDACAPNLMDRACDHCGNGFHWAGTRCSRCADIETTYLLFPTIPSVLVPSILCLMYKFFGDKYAKWGSWQNGVTALAFVTLNHFQTVDIMSGTNLRFPDVAGSMFSVFQFTNNYASVFKLDCIGMADFRATIIMRGLAPPILLGYCLATFLCSILIAKITKRAWVMMDSDRLCNVFGSLMFTFFSAIAAVSLLLFKCSKNPNGTQSLNADMGIICFDSSDWQSMLVAGIIFVLLYIVGMGGAFVRAVLVAPRCFASPGFQMRWKFLFIKFRADVYWWSIVFLAKNFFINLAFVMATEGIVQLYTCMLVTTVYMMLVVAMNPYRHRIANALEFLVSVTILYIVALLTWHADRHGGLMDRPVDLAIALVCLVPLVVGAGCILNIVLFGSRFPAPQWQRDDAEKDFKDLVSNIAELSILTAEEGADIMLSLSDWDRWYMKQTAHAIKSDVFEHSSTSQSRNRVVDTSLQKRVTRKISETKLRQSSKGSLSVSLGQDFGGSTGSAKNDESDMAGLYGSDLEASGSDDGQQEEASERVEPGAQSGAGETLSPRDRRYSFTI